MQRHAPPSAPRRALRQQHVPRVAVEAREEEDAPAAVREAEGRGIDDAVRPRGVAELLELRGEPGDGRGAQLLPRRGGRRAVGVSVSSLELGRRLLPIQ